MAIRKCRARQSMQRLGISKVFTLWASEIRSISEATEVLKRILTKKEKAPFDENYLSWLTKGPNERPKLDDENKILTELQHYYIYHHPSKTGWLSKHGFKEYAESLPRKLNIVNSSYDVTDMGEVLQKGLIDCSETEAFLTISEDINPLLLPRKQMVFFLYNLLSADGDFLVPFAHAIHKSHGLKEFSYLQAGNSVPKVIDDILLLFSGLAYTSGDREQLSDLERMKASVEKDIQDASEKKGSGSRREQECISRLEWLVDLDILKKAASRTYAFTELGASVVSSLGKKYEEYVTSGYADQAIQKILDRSFYEVVKCSSYIRESTRRASPIDFLQFIRDSYDILRGISGYCVFRPLMLLANIQAAKESQEVFLEYNFAIQLLEKAFREHPDRIYYTTDRFGTDVQVKLS